MKTSTGARCAFRSRLIARVLVSAFAWTFILPLLFSKVLHAAVPKPQFSSPLVATSTSVDIRVRLARVSSAFTVSGQSLEVQGLPQLNLGAEYRALRFEPKISSNRIQWSIIDRDTGEVIARSQASNLEVRGSLLRLNLKPVPSRLSFAFAGGGVDLVSVMDLETYVKGVLPGEMPSTWPLEALKAQAVAARTFALYRKKAREKISASYDLESTVLDQVFIASAASEHEGQVTEKVERAVSETRGLTLSDHKARPFATYFHADCGGRTEEARQVWGQGEVLGTTSDESCPMSPKAKWTLKLNAGEISSRLGRVLKRSQRALASLTEITVANRTESGRVGFLKLTWSDGSEAQIPASVFRMTMGFDRVRSTRFDLAKSSDGSFEFSGLGHGHGVGLCQWGTKAMAVAGRGFKEILAHYYPKAALVATK